MADQIVANRYAEALVGAIEDRDRLDEVCDEVRAIAALIDGDAQLKAFLEGPSIGQEHKHALVKKVFGDRIQPVTLDFIDLLLHKHRIAHFSDIADAFTRMVEERRHQVRVKVATAFALPVDMQDRLKRALDVTTGKDCILETRVDPRVIGGVVAVVGDRVIDGSLRASIDELRKQLMAAPLQ